MLQGIAQTETINDDFEGASALVFVENQKMLKIVSGEEIGFLENPYQTKASESIAEGKELNEGTTGRGAQLNLTTKNALGRQ